MKPIKSVMALLAIAVLSTGCATVKLASYTPEESGQEVRYDNGVGIITAENDDVLLVMYPTFKLQEPTEIPTFTLSITNKTDHLLNFNPANITASIDSKPNGVYSLEQRVGEIRSNKIKAQVAMAIIGGISAAAAANAASHSSSTYTSYGYVGRTPFAQTARVDSYDPLAGMVVGGAVIAGTGVAIHQIENSAGNQEAAAQGILQRSTLAPGQTVTGQVMIRRSKKGGQMGEHEVQLVIPVETHANTFRFRKVVNTY